MILLEAIRRGFVAAATAAQSKNLKIPLEKTTIQDLSNQIWEYIQLTDKNSKIVKIWYWQTSVDKFYLFPSKIWCK